jgi:hypothetical protein
MSTGLQHEPYAFPYVDTRDGIRPLKFHDPQAFAHRSENLQENYIHD